MNYPLAGYDYPIYNDEEEETEPDTEYYPEEEENSNE